MEGVLERTYLLVLELGGVLLLEPLADGRVLERARHAAAVLDLNLAQRVRLGHQLDEA